MNKGNVERIVRVLRESDTPLKQETISATILAYQSGINDRPIGLFMVGCEEFMAGLTVNDVFRWLGAESILERRWIGGLHWYGKNPITLRTYDILLYAEAVLKYGEFVLTRKQIYPDEPQNDN